ncbi:MAG: alkaline phosphatase D family protein [Myxococcales bacterium]|nr:alkaline phosphatase D family protein [Myxococcales bacterium]
MPIIVMNPDGSPRTVPTFPSGGGTAGTSNFANTLDDYRHLYKTFGTDPDLQAARARWPFVHTWDDHEFSDDCWQSMANYTDAETLDEPSQRRKLAANQAWFEYVPSQLTGAVGVTGVTQDAHDFAAATVADAAFTAVNADNFVPEPNNVAAVGSVTIYRSLRFGQHCELIVTDLRSYRSDHAVPEETFGLAIEYLNPRYVLPVPDVETLDAGATANGGNPPAMVGITPVPNPRLTTPPGTMLGAEQKAWWKASMQGSTATWKVWGNQVPFMRFYINKGPVISLIVDRLMSCDAWDGYPSERKELTQFLRTNNIKNVVLLTGDIHAHFAGTVSDNFASTTPTPVGVEFIAAGISSNSVFSFYESASRPAPGDVRSVVTYDARPGRTEVRREHEHAAGPRLRRRAHDGADQRPRHGAGRLRSHDQPAPQVRRHQRPGLRRRALHRRPGRVHAHHHRPPHPHRRPRRHPHRPLRRPQGQPRRHDRPHLHRHAAVPVLTAGHVARPVEAWPPGRAVGARLHGARPGACAPLGKGETPDAARSAATRARGRNAPLGHRRAVDIDDWLTRPRR